MFQRALIASFCILLVAGCKDTTKQEVIKAPPIVAVVEVHFASAKELNSLAGIIKPRQEADLGFRIPGKIAKRFVDVGQIVKSGNLLASLDETDLQLQLEQAQAEVEAAKSNLDTATNSQKRLETLGNSGWATRADIERIQTAMAEAQGRFVRAQRTQSLAQNNLDYAQLRADRDGIISAVSVEVGQVVAAGQPCFRLAGDSEKEIAVAVPENQTKDLTQMEAKVALWSDPQIYYPAHLRELSSYADPVARTYAARFSIENAGSQMRFGMSATLYLHSIGQAVARLPLSALFDQGEGSQVYVFDPETKTVVPRIVKIDRIDDKTFFVNEGVKEGELVVAFGTQKLKPHAPVRAQNYTAY